MAERMVDVNGVELCTEPFGSPTDPPILLVMGLGASMLWWDESFCRMLADHGRFVIRYDHRDTGRSATYEPGGPGYSGTDLVTDAVGVLDACGLAAAHVVGVSAGGAIAQLLALDFADRVLSLVLISISPATPGDRGLPPPTGEFGRFVARARVDWSNPQSVIEYLVVYPRVLAGGKRPFDEAALRELVGRDVARARNIASLQNHDVLQDGEQQHEPLSSIAAPTLVIHGAADPMFPLAHGEALANEIPGATFLPLEQAGHGIDREDWTTIVRAIVHHTAPASKANLRPRSDGLAPDPALDPSAGPAPCRRSVAAIHDRVTRRADAARLRTQRRRLRVRPVTGRPPAKGSASPRLLPLRARQPPIAGCPVREPSPSVPCRPCASSHQDGCAACGLPLIPS
ncbi:MAG: alpha/beta fold hydrolase [Acidimicrobiales bacterium]